MIYEIKNEFLTVKVESFGAEVISALGVDGFEYIYSGKTWSGHAPVLFPLCGRIKDERYTHLGKEYSMKLHGLAKYYEFSLKEKTEDSVTFLFASSDATREQYPFEFNFTVRYALEGKSLIAVFTVENLSGEPLPYMVGWHPGFNYDPSAAHEDFYLDFGDAELRLHPVINRAFIAGDTVPFATEGGKYKINDDELDDYDTLVLENTNYTVKFASDAAPHGVRLSWSENIPNFCVWRAPFNKAPYLCLEPWSNLPGDGSVPEDFSVRDMIRIPEGAVEDYRFTVDFLF